ncbi:MAG: Zn-dependent hydrolase [Chloroflexi bacterium]|nr:Zn-dependent hydrolase [Chloroflexota bacterium]
MRINDDRLKNNFEALSQIGATTEGGVHRPTFSPAHLEARAWFRERSESAGLDFQIDNAGNHSAVMLCANSDAPTLLLGSHLDSVPNGGRFDGAIGVLSAFEVLLTIKDEGIKLPFHLEAIDFTDEEGTLHGLLGSEALTGILKSEDLISPRGGREQFLSGLAEAGLTEEGLFSAQRSPISLAGYLEVHIEQGNRLTNAQADIGIVTSIVGINSCTLTFIGRADHAGTTPMDERLDASLGASAFTLAARKLVMRDFPDCVVNVGAMDFEPGAFNIVPAGVDLSLEFRAPDDGTFEHLKISLLALAEAEAHRYGLSLKAKFLGKHEPAPLDPDIQEVFKQAAESLDVKAISLASFAGHDAQSLARVCPAGMIFIPSVGGSSHSPREFTEWDDCVNGANVLLQAALNLVNSYLSIQD